MNKEAGERPFQHIFQSVSDGLIIHDAQTGLVVEANAAACVLYGCTRQQFIGQPLTAFLHPNSHQLLNDYRQTAQAGEVFAATVVHLRRDGTPFSGEIRGTALTYGEQPCLLSVVRNVSQRVQEEQALAQQTKDRLETRASQATSQERQRLAQNLHDAVNQSLFSASLIAEVLPRLWERDPEEGRHALEDLRRLTRGAMAEMRGLLAELRPLVLTDSELGDLLRQFGDALTGRTNIPVQVTVTGSELGPLPADVQVAFYRVCQEALTNIAKHAGASQVEIDLRYEADAVTLRIRDNGRGFDMAHTPAGHYGLSMMRERAKTIGAKLSVASQPGQGAEIVIRWKKRLEKEAR